MTKAARNLLFAVSAIQYFFAIAFFFQWPFAVQLWPFPGTTPLTYILLASFFAAAASSTLWVVATEYFAAAVGIGLDYLTIFAPISIYSIQLGARSASPAMTGVGIACAVAALFGLGLVIWGLRFPMPRSQTLPGPVRWSFVVFVAALLLAGSQLIFKVPNIIPWMITPELSVIIGWMFLGASVYFMYGLLRPGWWNAAGQLAGFLTYDVVLIAPFLLRLPVVAAEHRLSLIIYISVVIFSGLLATYYLFMRPATRLGSRGTQLVVDRK